MVTRMKAQRRAVSPVTPARAPDLRRISGTIACTIPYPTNHAAEKAPTCQNDHPSVEARKTGSPTTNQTSRALKRKSRAAESQFTAGLLENSLVNFTLDFAFPIPLGRAT